jgi:hypothetical protein
LVAPYEVQRCAALSGLFAGGVIGFTHGARDVYDVVEPQPRFVPSGPPSSVTGGTWRF